jgi:hypothetical protein
MKMALPCQAKLTTGSDLSEGVKKLIFTEGKREY